MVHLKKNTQSECSHPYVIPKLYDYFVFLAEQTILKNVGNQIALVHISRIKKYKSMEKYLVTNILGTT